jgi:alpha-tubulin suppressor-like RCC1 family protein
LPKDWTKVLRIWSSKSKTEPVVFVELQNAQTYETKLHSAGFSEKGVLGQGQEAMKSVKFKPVSTECQFKDLSVSDSSVMAISRDGKLWGWGLNTANKLGLADEYEGGIPAPLQLHTFNDLKLTPMKVSCANSHSLVLFQDHEGNQRLYSVGVQRLDNYCHLGCAEELTNDPKSPFRPIAIFDDRKIKQFVAHDQFSSLVILDDDNSQIFTHKLPDGSSATGLLHFYQGKGGWQFVTE